jgi:hypothetical protein
LNWKEDAEPSAVGTWLTWPADLLLNHTGLQLLRGGHPIFCIRPQYLPKREYLFFAFSVVLCNRCCWSHCSISVDIFVAFVMAVAVAVAAPFSLVLLSQFLSLLLLLFFLDFIAVSASVFAVVHVVILF